MRAGLNQELLKQELLNQESELNQDLLNQELLNQESMPRLNSRCSTRRLGSTGSCSTRR